MPRYISTRGKGIIAIGICDRCSRKVPYVELRPDGDSPGLRVCKDRSCWDRKDPWKLPARHPENITLRNPRPDTRIGIFDQFLVTEGDAILITESGQFIITHRQNDL